MASPAYNYRIVWFDPGGYTGWATYSAVCQYDVHDEPSSYNHEKWAWGYLGPEEHHRQLEVLIEHLAVADYTVGYERFDFRQKAGIGRTGLNLISREYIGTIKGTVKRWNETATHRIKIAPPQHSMQALDLFGKKWEKLDAMGIMSKPRTTKPNKDMNLAKMHLVYYMVVKLRRNDIAVKYWKDLEY